MPFWTYMLHLEGGLFYVGHTDSLEHRVGEHQSGRMPGYTARFSRIELAWSEEFQTRDDAKACERKLKGWSRAKKLALIRGDWAEISNLGPLPERTGLRQAQAGRSLVCLLNK